MSLEYEKTAEDARREARDLEASPINRFLKHKDSLQFNIGDIVIKQNKMYGRDEWKTELTSVGTPVKYMYVFENEVGVGYLKQLKVDGTGFTTLLTCIASYDPRETKFILDPNYADHLILGDDREKFQYNQEYLNKRKFRDEAKKANQAILEKTKTPKQSIQFATKLKVGDCFWMGWTIDSLVHDKYTVVNINSPGTLHATLDIIQLEDYNGPIHNGRAFSAYFNFFPAKR